MKNFGLVKGQDIDLLKVVTDMSCFIAVCMCFLLTVSLAQPSIPFQWGSVDSSRGQAMVMT